MVGRGSNELVPQRARLIQLIRIERTIGQANRSERRFVNARNHLLARYTGDNERNSRSTWRYARGARKTPRISDGCLFAGVKINELSPLYKPGSRTDEKWGWSALTELGLREVGQQITVADGSWKASTDRGYWRHRVVCCVNVVASA